MIDHLAADDAKKALKGLLRVTKPDGLILITFDIAEEEDFTEEHITLEDGTMEYVTGNRKGMLFNPHDWSKIEEFLKGCNVIYRGEKTGRERIVILRSTGTEFAE